MDCDSTFLLYHDLFTLCAPRGGVAANIKRNLGNPYKTDGQRQATDEQIAEGMAFAWREWCQQWSKSAPGTDQDAAKLAQSVGRRIFGLVARGTRFEARRGPRVDTMDCGNREGMHDDGASLMERGPAAHWMRDSRWVWVIDGAELAVASYGHSAA